MTNSQSWSKQSGSERRGARKREKPPRAPRGATDLDRPLKLATAQALASAGFYVRTNVVLSEPRDVSAGKLVVDVTDVDVLGVQHTVDFRADLSCVTCKGGRAVNVIHESFALVGVMRYLQAHRGYAVFAEKATEGHMIALAEQLGVMLLDNDEWQHWLKRVAGPYPVPRMFEGSIDAIVADRVDRWTDLSSFVRYLRGEFWYFRDYRNVQMLVALLRRSSDKLNASPLAQFIVLDAASLFALAVLQLCDFVNTSGLLRLRETAPPYLFGGVASYRQRRELLAKVEELLRRKGVMDAAQAMPRLDPPYIADLLEVAFRFANKPAAAARVPQYLSVRAGLAAAQVAGVPSLTPAVAAQAESEFTEKLALDLVALLARASNIPQSLTRQLLQGWDQPPQVSQAVESATEPVMNARAGQGETPTGNEDRGSTPRADAGTQVHQPDLLRPGENEDTHSEHQPSVASEDRPSGRHKFQIGDRVVGRDEAPASFRGRQGIVKEFVRPGEYGVLFEDDRLEYVMSSWIAAV